MFCPLPVVACCLYTKNSEALTTSYLKHIELAKILLFFLCRLASLREIFIAPAKQQRRKEVSKVFLRQLQI
jgi:hypothetical protein